MRSGFILLAMLVAGDAFAADKSSRQLLHDAGFEMADAGQMTSTTNGIGWEVQRIGRKTIQQQLIVECVKDKSAAHAGNHALKLSIPRKTVGFEFVTVGQRLKLRADREYTASVWVRWPDGPAKAPAKRAGAKSAIVSFWVRHSDAKGEFAGRDVWLYDRNWTKLTFRFRATDPTKKSLVYVSLLPNQLPARTTVFIDDFRLEERSVKPAAKVRSKNLVQAGGFQSQAAGAVRPPWSFFNIGGKRITGRVTETDGKKFVRVAMNKNTSNFESAQLSQYVTLKRGVRYDVRCRMKWDSFSKGPSSPIVNYGFYHEASNTWYGPVDQNLKKTGDWVEYRFTHIPPYDGKWKLYVQLNGWGNFGRKLTVSFDDFRCVAVGKPPARQ